jgi:hypothetical protein
VTPPRLTPEHEAEIHAEFRKSGRLSALSVAYLLDELNAVRNERNELWALLDNIDTLDELARRQQKRRFDIYNPEAHEGRGGSGENRGGPIPERDDRVVALPEARGDLQEPAAGERLLARVGGADSGTSGGLMTCRHIWEADDQGVQCCALCGVTAK